MTQSGETAESKWATLLARTRSPHHHSCPRLVAVVDPGRTQVGNTGRFRTRLSECAHRNLEGRSRMQGPASAKAVGSPSDRWCSRCCSGPQHIRSGDQRSRHEGWGRPLTPGESGSPSHRRIDHRVRLAPKGYTEDFRVLGDGSTADYMRA